MAELDKVQYIENDLTEQICPKGVENIQYIYLFLIGILPFSLLLNVLFRWDDFGHFFSLLFEYLVFLGIYYGISRVKSWVVIFVLLVSYWGSLSIILFMLYQQADISELMNSRIIPALYLCFFVYQIIVFSRKETKEYFKVKGKVII